ncbi:helix-turn-helix transcriptional regulator [Nocardia gipuzkoensis]
MGTRADLSQFLRTRRARLHPDEVGLQHFGRPRRVPGLRRQELAQLAGVSVDYYVRLEQGRTRNVSDEILDAVARALQLSDDERAHLFDLAKPARAGQAAQHRVVRVERVRPGLQRVLDMATEMPAYIVGRRCDVLAWNRMACLLFGDFATMRPQDRNWGRLIFLNEDVQSLYDDWTIKARETVSYLRLKAGAYPNDQELATLIGELSVKSDEFRAWWASHDVRDKTYGTKTFHHPLVGEMALEHETLRLPDDSDQVLVTYTAQAQSPAETALRLLSTFDLQRNKLPLRNPEA